MIEMNIRKCSGDCKDGIALFQDMKTKREFEARCDYCNGTGYQLFKGER